jgi:DNA polymerase (family 10)
VENVEIAAALAEVADLLDIQGENPFKVRAYRNAVRTIQSLTRPLAEMVAQGSDLEELPGIGHDLAAYIVELVESGHLRRLERLEKEIPATLTHLMRVEGLGPKKARKLWDELGIRSLDDLADALEKGKVGGLKGFGPKTISNLQRSLQELQSRPARVKLCDADQLVRPLLAWMAAIPEVERVEAAGSYRRRAETVGDVDLLVVGTARRRIMERFTSYPDVARVEAAGTTRGTVVLEAGLQVDLRVLPAHAYGAALHYFTGCKAHNIAVRALGVERGLRISEYGVFTRPARAGAKARRIAGETEAEVFRAVGLPWIPPELREDRGEIEAARAGRLPRLLTLEDVRGDLQMHSTWSDGHDSVEAMALAAAARGYEYLAVTDHSHAVTVAGGLDEEALEKQWKEVASVRRKLHGKIHLFRGLEVDILRDGRLDLDEEHLSGLDLVVASVHSSMRMSKKAMTERVIRALQHPAVDILAHPTGRILNERAPYELDVEAVLAAAVELNVAVELNAQPDRLDLSDVYVRRAKELGVKVAIDTDAHGTASLAFISYGVDQARRGWLERGDVLNALPLAELCTWLARRRRKPGIRTA